MSLSTYTGVYVTNTKAVLMFFCFFFFCQTHHSPLTIRNVRLLPRVEEHRTRHQNGMGKGETLSLIYNKCMQPGSLNRDKLMH